MNNDELLSKIESLESILYRVVDFLAIDTEKVDLYKFISNESVRRQLELDFVLMEKTPASRFDSYCQNAFFQIENILNYYFTIRFSDNLEDAKKYFSSRDDNSDDLKNMESVNYRVSKIPYGTKFFYFSKEFMSEPGKSMALSFSLQNIAYVRNSTIHKNSIDIDKYEEEIYIKYRQLRKKYNNDKLKYSDLSDDEDKEIFSLGQKIGYKKEKNFTKVKTSIIGFVDLIRPFIESHQKGG